MGWGNYTKGLRKLFEKGGASGSAGWSVGDLDTTHSPVGLWTFTGGTLADSSGNANTLVLQEGVTRFADFLGGTWLCLDGASRYEVTTETSLEQIGDLTISADVCFVAAQGSDSYLVGRGKTVSSLAADNWNYLLRMDGTQYGAVHQYGTRTYDITTAIAASRTHIASAPHRVSQVRDTAANTYTWFVNGQEVESDVYTSDPTGGAAGPFILGGGNNGAQFVGPALLRNVKIIPSALTGAEELAEFELAWG